MSDDPRVVITGVGVISALGIGIEAHWEALAAGRTGIDRITLFDPGEFDVQVAAEVKGFQPRKMVPQRKALKVMARDIQLATAAAELARVDCGLEPKEVEPERFGVVLGAGLIISDIEELAEAVVASRGEAGVYDSGRFGSSGREVMFPLWLLKHLPNMPASHISIFFNAQGPNNSITTACAAGLQAIGEATQIIQRGDADIMITGAVDSRIKPLNFIKTNSFGILARGGEARCRPYDRHRTGMVIGEGAAVLVIERADHARARSARILAEIAGYGSGAGPFRVLEPEPGACYGTRAMRRALQQAGVEAEALAAVFGSAVGARETDLAEARTLRQVLGDAASRVPVHSARGAYGHTWAASGALAAADAAHAITHGLLPPTAGFQEADPDIDLNVSAEARPLDGDAVLLNAHAFGGQDASLVIRRFVES
jgi:3-oxoacyl-[acyl-carrier-protein] synthase II